MKGGRGRDVVRGYMRELRTGNLGLSSDVFEFDFIFSIYAPLCE